MALDYRKCAQEIVDHIGGRENVAQAAHCATRLRLVIKDNSKVDKAYLDNVDGVKGMFESNGQLQLIIGTGTVNKVYDEFLAITDITGHNYRAKINHAVKKFDKTKKYPFHLSLSVGQVLINDLSIPLDEYAAQGALNRNEALARLTRRVPRIYLRNGEARVVGRF